MDARRNTCPVQYDYYLVGVGVAGLAMGCLFYALTRTSPHIFLLSDFFTQMFPRHSSGSGWGALPTFIHTFSFVLISVGIVGYRRSSAIMAIASLWVSIELLLELGQHPVLEQTFVNALPNWLQRVPVFDQTAQYFMRGTYDIRDVAAIFAAAGLAVLLIQFLHRKGECYEQAVTYDE